MVSTKEKIRKFITFETMPRLEIVVAATLIFTIIIYPSLSTKKETFHQLGEISTQNIKAPRDFLVEDSAVTEARRITAEEAILTVYDYDQVSINSNITKIHKAFADARIAVEKNKASDIPSIPPENAAPTGTISIVSENGAVVDQIDSMTHADILDTPNYIPPPPAAPKTPPKEIRRNFDSTVDTVGIPDAILRTLEADDFSKKTENAIIEVLTEISKMLIVSNNDVFIREAMRGISLRNISTQSERTIINLNDFVDVSQVKAEVVKSVALQLDGASSELIQAATQLVEFFVQPNVTLNRNETQARKTAARNNVKPVLYQIKTGEMIVREGEAINEVHLVKLSAMGEKSSPLSQFFNSLGMATLIFMLLISSYYIFFKNRLRRDANVNRQVLFMSTIFMAFFVFTQVAWVISKVLAQTGYEIVAQNFFYALPLAAAPMIVCQFLNWRAAAPFAIISATAFALVFDNNMDVFVYFFVTGTIAAYLTNTCHDRKAFASISLKIGFLNILMVIILALYNSDFSAHSVGLSILLAIVNAILTPMVTMGITPLIEYTFGYNTNMTMLELANLDKPLLKRLILEAAGTYHHSILVGSLAESAASEIGANPLVAKVGGYYHDIGKLNKPNYFIENISRSQNKHDKLAPSMSSLILQAHVKDGVEMAKEYKLGKALEDIIKQHHGTSTIRYFYEKAKSMRTDDMPEIDIEDYRYPGPKPQSKEAALVMLADVIEASSRALQNPTSARLKGLVQKMINEIFADGQLSDCDLTLRDLHKIANNFHKMLCGIHHSRIDYPDATPNSNKDKGSSKNGNSDRKLPATAPPDRNAYAGGGAQLKGLGDE